MDPEVAEKLKICRKQTLLKVLDALDQSPPIYIVWEKATNRYFYKEKNDNPVSVPSKSGIYIFYSLRYQAPVYVGQALNIKRRLGDHCRVSGTSIFKKRWVRHWIGEASSEEDVVSFIHSHMYLKYLLLNFGRCEIESDLVNAWGLHDPGAVDPRIFCYAPADKFF